MLPTEGNNSSGAAKLTYGMTEEEIRYYQNMTPEEAHSKIYMVSTGMGTAMERNRYELATGKFIATSTYKPAEALGEKNMDKVLDGVQTALDVAGMVPGIGEAADFVNGLISVVRGDYAGAAISFASMLPIVGAAGPVFKQLENLPDWLKEKILKKLMDLFNSLKSGGLKKTLDGASAAMDDIFKDIAKEMPELGEALTDIKDVICKNGSCFVAGTKVHTTEGLKVIEEIKQGDLVYARNPESGEEGVRRVKKISVSGTYVLYHIYMNGEKIDATGEHPFWVYGRGFVQTADLKDGDELVSFSDDGEYAGEKIERVEKSLLTEKVLVYNFVVEDWHTYFVGGDRLLVHNPKNVPCETLQSGANVKKKLSNGTFENAPYHGKVGNSVKSRAPIDGQSALDNSVSIGETTTRRVGVSEGEFVVLDETQEGIFHGHVRNWGELTQEMKNALIKSGVVNRRGKLL